MTIAAGFRCPEGIVLCADSQETVGEFLKRSQPKIVIRAEGNLEYGDIQETRAVFACAGDGPFIDMTVEKVWRQMQRAGRDQATVVEALEDELIRVHQRYWPLYTERDRPQLAMLIAIYTPEAAPTLWKADGPVLNEIITYDCIGYGLSLGKYIGDRLYHTGMETNQAALLAIYLLEQAKNAVQYCGGESHVVMMPLPGWIYRLDQEYVSKAVTAFSNFEKESNRLLLKALEFQLNEQDMLKAWADFYEKWPEFEKKITDLMQRVGQFKQSATMQAHPAHMSGITEPVLPPNEQKKS